MNTYFVLVRPVYLGNIGSVARVLKNFGFTGLRLVAPPKNYKDAEARQMAVGAFDVLKKAQVFDTLADALKDINIAVGTTSGQQRQNPPVLFDTIAPQIAADAVNQVAIVFGDERNGLSREELDRCHHVVTLHCCESFPALNMAQAVGIFAYELSRKTSAGKTCADLQFASGAEGDQLLSMIESILESVEFTRSFNRRSLAAEINTLYQRLHPTEREFDLLRSIIFKIDQRLKG